MHGLWNCTGETCLKKNSLVLLYNVQCMYSIAMQTDTWYDDCGLNFACSLLSQASEDVEHPCEYYELCARFFETLQIKGIMTDPQSA